LRQAEVYGVRPTRTFEEAAVKFVRENQHKRSIEDDIGRLRQLMPWIGDLGLDQIGMGALQGFVESRRKEGAAAGTINHGLKVVCRIVNLAASEWTDEFGTTWLLAAPKIRLLLNRDKRPPHPLSWEEQGRLFRELPTHLAEMALFAVNTGCRDGEICNLQWSWEVPVPELETSVFIVPGRQVKNGDDRLIVLNEVAKHLVEPRRGMHSSHDVCLQRCACAANVERCLVSGAEAGRA
jgi:integrase